MTDEDIENWAQKFASDLTIAGERVPLDRVIATHLRSFEALRAKGMTWRAIANVLSRAGACRPDGSPISHDQLRADVARSRRKMVHVGDVPPEAARLDLRAFAQRAAKLQ